MSPEPRRLGKYELQETLGRGGMGEVWKARDTELQRFVAVKLLRADLQANPDFVTRFTREARFLASLHHPNIIEIHDFQFIDTWESDTAIAYMVMDYVEGGTLADYIRDTSRRGSFPSANDIVSLFTAISLALDYAHQKGMLHRDIKPANILLDKRNPIGKPMGEPILTDFGIAKLQGTATGTLTGTMLGTPLYVAPEQAQGLQGDERTDLYSLGIILYEMVTGITPFRGDNPIAILMQHLYESPTPPAHINPNVPPALSAVILQSIAKDPAARFPTASSLTVALAQALNVPVPASLNKSQIVRVESDDNPLQPANPLPGIPSHLAHLATSPSSAFTPVSGGNGEVGYIAPLNPAQVPLRDTPPLPTLVESPSFPSSPPAPLAPPRKSRRRGVTIALIACITLVLVGIAAFAVLPLLSQKGTIANPPGKVVGQLVFLSSQGTFDQVRIELQSIPAPAAGKTYYAWLENSRDSEAEAVPHWKIVVDHGSVDSLYPGDSRHTNLLVQSTRFLITQEDASASPHIPYPDLSARFYYAQISQNGPTTFDVKACSSSSTSDASNPCR